MVSSFFIAFLRPHEKPSPARSFIIHRRRPRQIALYNILREKRLPDALALRHDIAPLWMHIHHRRLAHRVLLIRGRSGAGERLRHRQKPRLAGITDLHRHSPFSRRRSRSHPAFASAKPLRVRCRPSRFSGRRPCRSACSHCSVQPEPRQWLKRLTKHRRTHQMRLLPPVQFAR